MNGQAMERVRYATASGVVAMLNRASPRVIWPAFNAVIRVAPTESGAPSKPILIKVADVGRVTLAGMIPKELRGDGDLLRHLQQGQATL